MPWQVLRMRAPSSKNGSRFRIRIDSAELATATVSGEAMTDRVPGATLARQPPCAGRPDCAARGASEPVAWSRHQPGRPDPPSSDEALTRPGQAGSTWPADHAWYSTDNGCLVTLRRLFESESSGSALRLPRHQTVYGLLDRDRSLYLIERGQVKAVATSRDGKECLLGIYTAGDVFGELSLVCGTRTEMVTTMTPTVLRRMPSSRALGALSDAESREEFIRRLVQRLLEQQRSIIDLVTADSEYRLAAVLLHLGRKLGQREGQLLRIQARITQEELSAMVGTTRSRVGYFLKRFQEAGLVLRSRDAFLVVHESRVCTFMTCAR